jgi:tetratricopeptide (TPR) repeat protein
LKLLPLIICILIRIPLFAADRLAYTVHRYDPAITFKMDSLLPVRNDNSLGNDNKQDEEIISDLREIENWYMATGDNQRAFAHLLKILRLRKSIRDGRTRSRLFNDLAGVSARLKLYPLAMKCYYRAIQWNKKIGQPSLRDLITAINESRTRGAGASDSPGARASDSPDWFPDSNSITPPADSAEESADAGFLLDSLLCRQWVRPDTSLRIQDQADYAGRTIKSVPVQGEDIWESFNDGKPASSYALLVQVKQPVPGKRKSFTGINNVGHMFITLIKYNKDNSFVCRSFGFYPHKSTLFSGTPIQPGSESVFKNDAMHDWDEVAGKFISFRRFQKIVEVLKRYDQRTYHLNQNNCTDFGLTMARIGGIDIMDTRGSWPLGKGNNPGSAGQSMLQGKLNNIDADYHSPLFVSRNISLGGQR